MAVETERKFLVKSLSFLDQYATKTEILQRYLSVDPHRIIRLRITDRQAFLTVKSDLHNMAFSRSEWEYLVSMEEAKEIMEICLPGKIEKTRYYIPSEHHTFEVDVFHDKNEGLILAEIELSSVDESIEKPEWLGEEVTGNPDYFNSSLLK
jgi:adenylate cyclase